MWLIAESNKKAEVIYKKKSDMVILLLKNSECMAAKVKRIY